MTELIQDIINEYDDLGYAKKINNNTLESLDGENTIEIEPLLNSNKEDNGIKIYSNGTYITQVSYADANFVKKTNMILAHELNI